jgi:hypothetical protein
MAKLTAGRRITTEDFSAEEQDLVRKLAFILNPFMSEISSAFNGKITIDNLNMTYKTVLVTVDANGDVTNNAKFQNPLSTQGIIVTAASPTDEVSFITGAPFVTTRTSNGITEIQHVTGLQDGVGYRLNLLILGS